MTNLKPLVNDKVLWDSFVEYLDLLITNHNKQLASRDEPMVLYRLQGQVEALQDLKRLREKVNTKVVY